MAATDGPAFISETLLRLSSLEQQVGKVSGIESNLSDLNQLAGTERLDQLINAKITAILATQGNTNRDNFPKWPILESKSIQNLGNISDSKSYRDWNRKLKKLH